MIVYKIENRVNGKIYVGRTIRTLNTRIYQHKHNNKSLIGRAIQKYGWENFSVEIIEECDTFEKLVEREIYWIKKLNSKVPNGYNIVDGDCGFTQKKESITEENIFEDEKNFIKVVIYAINMIRGKWKLPIIFCLLKENNHPLRYNELKRRIPNITCIMLTKSLRELERDGLISRKIIKKDPPKEIEYSLTEEGIDLMVAMNGIYAWSLQQMEMEKILF